MPDPGWVPREGQPAPSTALQCDPSSGWPQKRAAAPRLGESGAGIRMPAYGAWLPNIGHPHWATLPLSLGLNGPLGVPGATLGSATAGESLHLSEPRFAHPWNGVSSDYSPPGTFSDLCLKGCSHWHKATWPWPDRADSIDSACHLHLQNGPCALWDFTSPCIAPLRHPGLGSVLPQPLPALSSWPQQPWPAPRRQQPGERGWRAGGGRGLDGVLPPPREALPSHRSAAALEWDGGYRRERGLSQAREGFVPGEHKDNVAVVCRLS